MAVAESLMDFRRGDSSQEKPPPKGSHAKGGGDRLYKNDIKEGSIAASTSRDDKGGDRPTSSQGLIVSCAMDHIGHANVLRGRPSVL